VSGPLTGRGCQFCEGPATSCTYRITLIAPSSGDWVNEVSIGKVLSHSASLSSSRPPLSESYPSAICPEYEPRDWLPKEWHVLGDEQYPQWKKPNSDHGKEPKEAKNNQREPGGNPNPATVRRTQPFEQPREAVRNVILKPFVGAVELFLGVRASHCARRMSGQRRENERTGTRTLDHSQSCAGLAAMCYPLLSVHSTCAAKWYSYASRLR
jgi:hypothetical protein